MQVLFALHDATLLSGMQLAGVTTKGIEPIHTGRSRVDIFLELYEVSGSVVGQIEYDSSLWKRSSIKAMAANFLVRSGLFCSFALDCTISILTGKLSYICIGRLPHAPFHATFCQSESCIQFIVGKAHSQPSACPLFVWQGDVKPYNLGTMCYVPRSS